MDILDKAKELGKLIADSEEMLNFRESEAEIEQDEKSRNLMGEYKALQLELVKATRGKQDKDLLEGLNKKLDAKFDEIKNYDVTGRYLTAKGIFDAFMKQVNNVLIYSISGEEPCSHGHAHCGGSCESCDGDCH